MNKSQTLLLADYLKDSTDLRLLTFVTCLNPAFKLTKSAKEQVKLLISDYQKDPSKQRLRILESFILEKVEVKGSKIVKKKPVDQLQALIAPQTEEDKKVGRIFEIEKEIKQIRQVMVSTELPKHELERFHTLKNELMHLEMDMGRSGYDPAFGEANNPDPNAKEKSELALVMGCVGDWNRPGTFAHEIVNGSKPQFYISGKGKNSDAFDMNKILVWLEKFVGKPIRKFDCKFQFVRGQGEGSGWVLTEKESGMAIPDENVADAYPTLRTLSYFNNNTQNFS